MPFSRPLCIPYPTVWTTFSVHKDGKVINFKVMDLTEDHYDEAMNLLTTHFTEDEPPCKYIKIREHPYAMNELRKLWRRTIDQRISIVCVREDTGEIVGVNVLSVCTKDAPEEEFRSYDTVWGKLYGAVDIVAKSVNVFVRYNVDIYLTAYGLVVKPQYRGLSIGKHILLARIPICRALHIKLTATVFTAAASQAVAKKAGFTTIYEMTYDKLASMGYKFPGINENTKSSMLMAMYIYP